MPENKIYLGDSVYGELDEYGGIWLTTNNGWPDDPRNKIYLEPAVLSTFLLWIERLRKEAGSE
jgi:hypothetical protein